jgi:hypothetical protein
VLEYKSVPFNSNGSARPIFVLETFDEINLVNKIIMSVAKPLRITLIGAGTIGLSFAALHLGQERNVEVIIFDTRPDIETYLYNTLPG